MAGKCKDCGSEERVRNGVVHGKQRYKCKICGLNYREGDERVKYSDEKRIRVIKWYLEGAGIRSIERMEGVPNPLIIHWIRKFGKLMERKIKCVDLPKEVRDVQILEIDELFSYCQKKLKESTYGFVLIGNEVRLLTLK